MVNQELLIQRHIVLDRAQHIAVAATGMTLFTVGVLILVAGIGDLRPVRFTGTEFVPWWLWGCAAVLAGILVAIPAVRVPGLLLCAAWWATWGVVLTYEIFAGNGDFYRPIVFANLASTSVLLMLLERVAHPRNRWVP